MMLRARQTFSSVATALPAAFAQDGTAQDDEFDTIALVANGRVVLTGSTFGPWDGAHGGRGDFAAVKLNTGNIPAA